jgi:uncharacterized membrane protein YraQ (UPF0718 family)
LVGVLAAGLIEAFLPDATVRFLAKGSGFRQALAGVAVGTPMPVCSCGVLPIYRSLIRKGVPATAALALLVAAPEIGVDSLLLSWNQLGPTATLARLLCALLLALAIGWFVGRLAGPTHFEVAAPSERAERRPSVWRALERGLFETWGHLSPWILVGLYATVLFEPWISTDWARSLPSSVQILALAAIGMPTYICASAATPFAALLLAKGFSTGAVIAFLLIGPATNLTTIGALRREHSSRVALAFVLTAFAVTFALAFAADLVLPGLGAAGPFATHEHVETWYHRSAAWGLIALTAWLVVRTGPRGFLSQLGGGSRGHDHAHEHAEGAACSGAASRTEAHS